MAPRKQKQQLLARLEEKRVEFLAAEKRLFSEMGASPFMFKPRRPELGQSLEASYHALEIELFIEFAQLAGVGGEREKLEDFADDMRYFVRKARAQAALQGGEPYYKQSPAMQKVVKALRDAAFHSPDLTELERRRLSLAFQVAFPYYEVPPPTVEGKRLLEHDWLWLLRKLETSAILASGASSRTALSRGGRSGGGMNDHLVVDLVREIWCVVRTYGGKLGYDRKNPSGGGMMTALNFLKPLFPAGFFRNVPYAAIETVRKRLDKVEGLLMWSERSAKYASLSPRTRHGDSRLFTTNTPSLL